ncbi:MAG: SGNH/GDSL hydrolase family protein [Candidatus Obscuribacterales bacterium]|nr:SGNH/GDSL hydrolase family protein [Candidatus Obscuribacterales bacterium]
MPVTQELLNKEATASRQTQPSKHRSWWLSLFELVALTLILVFAIEVFFAFAGVGQEEFLEPDPVLGVRHIPGKKIVWRLEGYSDEKLSSSGLRDQERAINKPANTLRIALLGDSATEGMQVSLSETYGAQLEAALNRKYGASGKQFEVINFGCSSYSNGQEMIQLTKDIAQYKPDAVVVMYNRGDYIENIRDPSTMKAEPRPYFYINSKGEFSQDDTIMKNNQDLFKADPVMDFLRRYSCIYGVISHTNLTLTINEPLYSKLRNTLLKRLMPGFADKTRAVQAPYTIQDPWQVTETIFKRIGDSCKSINSKLIIACFPNNVNERQYSVQIDSLKKLAEKENYGFVDLTPQVIYNKDPKSLFIKYHFSGKGHAMAAEQLQPLVEKALNQ